MSMARVWFITGASTGFGRATAEEVINRGESVIVAVRVTNSLDDLVNQYPSANLLVVRCDVTSPSDIESAFNAAYDKFGRIDVVFNNAGAAAFAEAETKQDDVARRVFEVNFWGATNVMKEAVRCFRERNPPGIGGRLLNNSSMAGISPILLTSYYTASKHALEGFAETFAKELDPTWNIKITTIEPGFFKTEIQNTAPFLDCHPAYTNPGLQSFRAREIFTQGYSTTEITYSDVKKGVLKVLEVSSLDEPPMRLPLGKDCVEQATARAVELQKIAGEFAHWSDDLMHLE